MLFDLLMFIIGFIGFVLVAFAIVIVILKDELK